MLFPTTLVQLAGSKARILITIVLAMSSAGLIAIVYVLATTGTGNLLDNIGAHYSGNSATAATGGSIHRGRSHSNPSNNDRSAPSASSSSSFKYKQHITSGDDFTSDVVVTAQQHKTYSPSHSADNADKHLMRQRIVHHLLPTAAPATTTTSTSSALSPIQEKSTTLLLKYQVEDTNDTTSSTTKEDGHIYIDTDNGGKSARLPSVVVATEESRLNPAVIDDTTEDITSIEYFDQIIADHKERNRHRMASSSLKHADWSTSIEGDEGEDDTNDDDEDNDPLRITPVVSSLSTTTTTLRPGRSINSRIVSKEEQLLVAPRQLLKQHLQSKKRTSSSGE